MLEDLGHEVIEANSGARALEILQGDRPVDLLVTDYSMPRMNGAQLAAAARQVRPELPVLLATGYAELPAGSAPACRGSASRTGRISWPPKSRRR